MKDAMKRREMDERTTRLLELAKAADQALRPLKPVMERLKPIYEVLNQFPSVPVVTDYKPLRAPGHQAPERNGLATPLEHRAPQNTDISPPNKAPGNAFPNYEDEKQRTTNLERAVRAARESMHRSTGRCATLDELIHYLKESDETDYILGAIGDGVAWSNTKGEKSTTGRRGIQKHWKKYAMTR